MAAVSRCTYVCRFARRVPARHHPRPTGPEVSRVAGGPSSYRVPVDEALWHRQSADLHRAFPESSRLDVQANSFRRRRRRYRLAALFNQSTVSAGFSGTPPLTRASRRNAVSAPSVRPGRSCARPTLHQTMNHVRHFRSFDELRAAPLTPAVTVPRGATLSSWINRQPVLVVTCLGTVRDTDVELSLEDWADRRRRGRSASRSLLGSGARFREEGASRFCGAYSACLARSS